MEIKVKNDNDHGGKIENPHYSKVCIVEYGKCYKVYLRIISVWGVKDNLDNSGKNGRFLAEKVLYEKKVVYLQRQKDKIYPYNQYAQLCSIQKKLKT